MKRNLIIAALVAGVGIAGWLVWDTYSTVNAPSRDAQQSIDAIDEALRQVDEANTQP